MMEIESMKSDGASESSKGPETDGKDNGNSTGKGEKKTESKESSGFFSSILNHTDEEVLVLAPVTIPPGKADQSTVNLMGPLVTETGSRLGRQVILTRSNYSHQHLLPSR